MFHTPIVLAPCAAVCKRIKRAKYAVCTHVLHTSYPSQIFLQKNAKWGLTFEDCIAIIAHAVRRCATEYVERWLSWSKAHDWKSCRAPKALKGSNPFLSAISPWQKDVMGCFCCIAQKWQNRRAIFEAHFIGQYRIILSADTASEVRQLLSQKRR